MTKKKKPSMGLFNFQSYNISDQDKGRGFVEPTQTSAFRRVMPNYTNHFAKLAKGKDKANKIRYNENYVTTLDSVVGGNLSEIGSLSDLAYKNLHNDEAQDAHLNFLDTKIVESHNILKAESSDRKKSVDDKFSAMQTKINKISKTQKAQSKNHDILIGKINGLTARIDKLEKASTSETGTNGGSDDITGLKTRVTRLEDDVKIKINNPTEKSGENSINYYLNRNFEDNKSNNKEISGMFKRFANIENSISPTSDWSTLDTNIDVMKSIDERTDFSNGLSDMINALITRVDSLEGL